MGHFLYMLEGPKTDTRAMLEVCGIADRFPETPGPSERYPCRVGVRRLHEENGPFELCDQHTADAEVFDALIVTRGKRCGFWPEEQAWERVEEPGKPVWYLGWFKEHEPVEGDLRRERITDGYMVALGNGEQWAVPTVRLYSGGSLLPETLRLGPAGEESGEVMAAYRPLFDAVSDWAERWYGVTLKMMRAATEAEAAGKGPVQPAPEEDLSAGDLPLGICYEILGVNYWIGRPEINVLGLMTRASRKLVALIAADWPGFQAITGAEVVDPKGG